MKTLSASLKAVIVASLACAAGLAAADTQILTVSATVVGTCKFSATTSTLAFGLLDQSRSADVKKKANVKYKCTTNTAPAGITVDTTPLAMINADNDSLPFTLSVTADTDKQTGKGLAADVSTNLVAELTGTIMGSDVQAAPAGVYTQDVTLTITN